MGKVLEAFRERYRRRNSCCECGGPISRSSDTPVSCEGCSDKHLYGWFSVEGFNLTSDDLKIFYSPSSKPKKKYHPKPTGWTKQKSKWRRDNFGKSNRRFPRT
jgi:hypothetical protein